MEAAYQPVDRLVEMLPQFPLEEINAQGPGGFTPLMIAIISEDKEINRRHKLRATPVRSDSSSGSEPSEQEMLLISRSPKFLHPLNTGGDIGHMYHHHHSRSLISAFAAVRADVNITNDYGQSALHLAAKHGRDDLISQLLCVKADPNLPDKWGQTPLHVSIGAATDRAFKALLDYHPKTSIDMRSQGGITPLMMAVKMANQSILQQLLTKGAEIAATDNEGRTVIHWAAMVNNVDALSVLTKHGPDNIKDAPNGRGETALFLACREGNYDAVKYLLFECYANSTLLDSLDRSPLHISYEKQHGDIVELLQQANQNSGIQPLAVYNHQKLSGAVHNPMYSRANGIKIEPEMHHPMLPPTYQQSTINPSYLPYPTITSSNNHQITESSIYRVSSIEAELERLVSSAMSYTNYSGHLPLHVSATTIQPTNAEVRPPEGVSPKGYSPGSSHSPALAYPTQSLEGSSQPLSHLPYESSYPTSSAGPFLQTPSSSTISSIEPNHPPPRHYNTALQPISHTSIPGGHSPPIGQTVSPNSVHNGARHPGFSPPMVPVTSDNQSPLSAYQCFPSPPKEAGEYPPFTKTSNTNGSYQADIINSLTPSPEDYSYQQSTENSPPQQQAILQGHYAYEYAPQSGHDIHPTQLPLFSVSYNARHESTV
jgi:ankyrin repeat protein